MTVPKRRENLAQPGLDQTRNIFCKHLVCCGGRTAELTECHFRTRSRHPADDSSQTSLPQEDKDFESDGAEPSWATKTLDSTENAKSNVWSYDGLEEENVWGK